MDATRGGWPMPDLVTDDGRFTVVFYRESGQLVAVLPDGKTTVRAHSWRALTELVSSKVGKARVQIEVPFIASDTGRRGLATGVDRRSNHPTVRWSDGHTEVYQGNATPLHIDTDTAQLAKLRRDAERATRTVARFLEDHRLALNVAAMVRHAIDAAAAAADTAAEKEPAT